MSGVRHTFRQIRTQHVSRKRGLLPILRQREYPSRILYLCQPWRQHCHQRRTVISGRLRAVWLKHRLIGPCAHQDRNARPRWIGRFCFGTLTMSQAYTTESGLDIEIRDIRPEDSELLVDLFYHLSAETIYKRFHAVMDNMPVSHIRRMAERLADIDPREAVALVAIHGGAAVGVARFHRLPGTADAESAIVIRDDYQKEGIGSTLLIMLRQRAIALGIEHLVAMVQSQNHPILKLIRRSGLESHWRVDAGETYLAVAMGEA